MSKLFYKVSWDYSIRILIVCLIGISIFMHTSTHTTMLVAAQPLSNINASTLSYDNNATIDPDLEVESMTNAFWSPFYILADSKDTGYEVVNLDPQQTKSSYITLGSMQ